MVTLAEPTGTEIPEKRRRWKLRVLVAGLVFAVATGIAVVALCLLASVLQDHLPPAPGPDRSLLSDDEGPPRVFAFLDFDLVNDDLAQLVDRLPPAGSAVNSSNVQVRTRRLLALTETLDRRDQLLTPTKAADWPGIAAGTVIRSSINWPINATAGKDASMVLAGSGHITIPAGALAWTPTPAQRLTVLAQTLNRARPSGGPARVDLRPLAVYTA